MKDYPAAHSMDSTWFAVDGAGEVAYFDGADEGFQPLAALSGSDNVYNLMLRLAKSSRGYVYQLNNLSFNERPPVAFLPIAPTLMILKDSQVCGEIPVRLPHCSLIELKSTAPVLWTQNLIDRRNLEMLFDLRLISAWCRHKLTPERFGFYVYNTYEGEPYEKTRNPEIAVNICELAEDIASDLAQATFDQLHFASEERVWPRRYFRCRGWQEADD